MLASQLFLSFFLFLFFNGEALVLSVDPIYSIRDPLLFDSPLFHNIKNKYYDTIYILKNYNI